MCGAVCLQMIQYYFDNVGYIYELFLIIII